MLYFYTTRICRNLSCCSTPKLFITPIHYSTNTKQDTRKISYLQEPPCITVGQKYPNREVIVNLPSNIHINKNITKKEEPEWRPMCVDSTNLHKYYLKLSKIRLTSLVVVTTMGGYALAPAPFDFYTFAMCSLGTGLLSAAANAINQFFEVPFDAQMSRTKNRILVRGLLTPGHAVLFATISGITGLSILYSQVNTVTALLGATNLFLYTLIYTPMKRISILNTWIGSIVGAIPPLMGWAGCIGDIAVPAAWIMSGLLYAWQFPHFNALSWNLRADYSRAGYRMMSVTNPDLCRRTALRYTAVLMGLCYLAPVCDVTNWWFAIASTPLNGYFLYLAWRFYQHSDSGSSRKLFRFSLIHLPVLMALMLVNKKHWFIGKQNIDTVTLQNENQQQRGNILSSLKVEGTLLTPSPSTV